MHFYEVLLYYEEKRKTETIKKRRVAVIFDKVRKNRKNKHKNDQKNNNKRKTIPIKMSKKKGKTRLSTERLTVSGVEIASPGLPESFRGFTIVHLSDLHGTLYGNHHRRLLHKIRQADPDVVVMTGDMTDHQADGMLQLIDLCRRLCRHWPVYYIWGNHEQCMDKKRRLWLLQKLKTAGVVILENGNCSIVRGDASIKIYGLVTPLIYYKDLRAGAKRRCCFTAAEAKRLLGKADISAFNLLLAHNPLYFPAYRDWGADLTLSGHIHGGIIRIPGLGGLFSPEFRFFPRYDAGHFEERGKHLVVSRGLGNNFLFRVANPPEIVVIRLLPWGNSTYSIPSKSHSVST